MSSAPGDDTFSPERCAQLHNELVQKLIASSPSAPIPERTFVARFLAEAPEFNEIPNLEDLPIHRFFSLIDVFPESPTRHLHELTPELHFPHPHVLLSDMFAHEPGRLLVYGQNSADPPFDGGLFLDLSIQRAVWHQAHWSFPEPDYWTSMEHVLRQQLEKWESGKFYWDPSQKALATRAWVARDMEDALEAWDGLVSAIEARLPGLGGPPPARLAPLDREAMEAFRISTFPKELLSRAPRPGFAYIAPGITTFSPESLVNLYSTEEPDAYRRSKDISAHVGQEEYVSLIFPSDGQQVPRNTQQSPNQDIQAFDEDWGYGKFTVNRYAGLYSTLDAANTDTAMMISRSGLVTACEFQRQRTPWGPWRSPRLVEILRHWSTMITEGIWEVGPDGVLTDHEWFDENLPASKIPW